MSNYDNGMGMPLGLGMALAQNDGALKQFAALTAEQQELIKNHASSIMSKTEMQSYVAELAAGNVSLNPGQGPL